MGDQRINLSWPLLLSACLGCADPVGDQIERLRSGDFEAKLTAIDQLGDAPDDPRVLAALAAALGDEPATEVRVASATALGRLGTGGELLLGALDDSEKPVRVAAAVALLNHDPNCAEAQRILNCAMLSGDGPVFLTVGKLGADGTWAIPTLIHLLKNPKARLRNVAAMTLGRIGPAAKKSLDAMRRAERDSDSGVRTQATEAIRQISMLSEQ